MSPRATFLWIVSVLFALRLSAEEAPFLESEFIFPPERWHVHSSCIVEAPNGDLLVCWFQGSGERKSDDVKIEGARLKKGSKKWSPRYVMADTEGFPDTNCAMFIDPQKRLWLIWPTILANTWESALLKVRIASDLSGDGAPKWESNDVIHIKPGTNFTASVSKWLDGLEKSSILASVDEDGRKGYEWLAHMRAYSTNKLNQRLGWMTRAHPFVLEGKRLIVPLYSDGFSFSMMAITDDWGKTWHTSAPLVGLGNIQPSIVQKTDRTLYALMRDNGPAPHRLAQSISKDRGETWSPVTDSNLPNPGSGAEIIRLENGDWVLISNDTEKGRNRLAVQLSDNDGKSWKWKRYLENSTNSYDGFHYPSIMQARDGFIHATYSHHLGGPNLPKDVDGDPAAKTIKHARFNAEWIKVGEAKKTASAFPLQTNDVVAFLGGGDVAAALFTGHLESLLAAEYPGARFRNFGWEGDTVFAQKRDFNFPPLSEHLKSAGAGVVVLQFGRIESMNGTNDLARFEAAYETLLDQFAPLASRLAMVTPVEFEASPAFPVNVARHNIALNEYAEAIRRLADARGLQLIDLNQQLRDRSKLLTRDGLQFTDEGHGALALAFARELSISSQTKAQPNGSWNDARLEQLRLDIQAKNRLWFDYWRPQNWAFLGGDRITQPSSRDHNDPKIRWFPEEMKRYVSLIADAEEKIQTDAHAIR
jgi:predicted neuraminidase